MQYLLSPFAHHLREYAAKLLSVNKKPAEAGFDLGTLAGEVALLLSEPEPSVA